jgi:aminoglycoside adenylyltransferase-like protein/nucleotidyltransferase-like protein
LIRLQPSVGLAVDGQLANAESRAMDHDQPTPESVLETLVSGTRAVLGGDLVGIYLYGSAVSGGFDPGVSDLDLVAVTSAEVEEVDLAGLEQMQLDIVGRNPEWSDRLEIVYIGWTTLQSFRTSVGSLAVISPGEPFHVAGDVAEWLMNWYLVRETGVTLYGVAAADVIPPIARVEFVAAVVRYADWLRNRNYADLGPGSLAYAVLSLCRALRTVRTGMPCSKQEAVAWTREWKPDWAWIIDAALRSRMSRGTTGLDDEQTRAAAESFIGLLADEITGSRPADVSAAT